MTSGGSADPASATVIGGSMAGILMAAALSAAGFEVTVFERDRLPGQTAHNRRGVPQDLQPHILLNRGMTAIDNMLPGYRDGLIERGAVPFNSGQMPWLGEFGWLDTDITTFDVVSASRPLMELVARNRLALLTSARVCEATVRGLRRDGDDWMVQTHDAEFRTAVVVDTSGRTSRLRHWLPGLTPQSETVDARVGYACRLYRQRDPLPLRTGVMIFGTVELGMAGLALPVEGQHWLVAAAGFGDRRPPREASAFDSFLDDLRDPALADLTAALDPVGEVAVHRQTANVRHRWDRVRRWPTNLIVAGDALCALNPVYGQGMTVAAQQAEILARASRPGTPLDRSVQRRMVEPTNAPWSIATTNDLRMPSCDQQASPVQRWSARWAGRVGRLAAEGNVRATKTIARVNHLMAPPTAVFHPALVASVVRGETTRRLPRPAVLEELSRVRRGPPPPAPAGA